jgi:microcin C transport system substrate-binding protein
MKKNGKNGKNGLGTLPLWVIGLTGLIVLLGCTKQEQSNSKTAQNECADWQSPQSLVGELDPIASPEAKPCGTLNLWGSSMPKSLNYWTDLNSFSAEIMGLLYESLLGLHSTKNEFISGLARSWSVSEDGMEFTFVIDSLAKWSDGEPITAQDVQFYYDVIMNPQNMTSVFRVGLSRLERPEIVDTHTLRVKAKQAHWGNFREASGLMAFPKKHWEGKDFNSIRFEFPVVSGPYSLEDVKKDRYVQLARRSDWWGWSRAYNQGKYNFMKVRYRFISDQIKALEGLKKGDLDALPVYTSAIWMKQTHFDAVKKNWIVRQSVYNKEPIGFQGMAINMRKPMFKDLKVRKALAHLLNRELLNEKYMYNQYFLQNSYYPDLYEGNQNPNAEMLLFDPDKARALLKEAGWIVNEKGVLSKGDSIFSISFITSMEDIRHLTRYQEDLKSVGIQVQIEKMSWSTIRQRLDHFDFDLYWINWGAGRMRDPEASWHSATAQNPGTNNLAGVEDSYIDSLIEVQKTEMDLEKRNEILKQIDTRLQDILPYVLMWNADHKRILYWNQYGTPASVFDKYNREESILTYWWYDAVKAKALQEARAKDKALSAYEAKVYWNSDLASLPAGASEDVPAGANALDTSAVASDVDASPEPSVQE